MFIQHLVKKNSRVISGKRPARCIRAVITGRQPDDKNPWVRIAKRRYRTRVIFRMFLADLLQESGKAVATAAISAE